MSWLLFMDESGHDHKNMPFEVRGGIAIHAGKIWPFIQDWHEAKQVSFGEHFAELGGEIKGSKLLGRKRLEWARQMSSLDINSRHRGVRRFLTKKLQGNAHTNTIEGFWSLLKRAHYGTHHHYQKKHIPLYVAEACWKYNNRKNDDTFGAFMQGCFA